MNILAIDRLDGLTPYAAAWNRLACRAAQRSPFLAHAWVASYLEHLLEPDQAWTCLLALDGDTLAGVLPVVHPRRRPRFGGKAYAPWHIDVRVGDLLAAPGREREAAAALLDGLDGLGVGSTLGLRSVPEGSPTLGLAREGLDGWVFMAEPAGAGSWLRTDRTYGEYEKTLGSNYRSNLRRMNKRLEGLGGVEMRFYGPDETDEEQMRQFFALEAAGWKGREGTAVLSDPRRTAFFTSLVRRLREAGMLEWHFLRAGGRLIAGEMAVLTDRTVTSYKIAFDEACSSCSPGSMLQERLIRRACADPGTDMLDFVSSMSWQKGWAVDQRTYYELTVCPRRPLPQLRSRVEVQARRLSRSVREYVKGSEALRPIAMKLRDLAR